MASEPHSGRAVGWVVVFAAVLAHLPALASYFSQDDWAFLARAAGLEPTSAWPPRLWSTVVAWKLQWPVFGLEAAAYHAVALVLLGLLAWLTARVGRRLGLDLAGAAAAGLVVAGTPLAVLPIAWASATAELWGAVFAMAALDRWLSGRGVFQPFLALVLGALSLLSKENALVLPLALGLATLWYPSDETERVRRARWVPVALLTTLAAAVALHVLDRFPHTSSDPYALGGPSTALRNLLLFGGWIVWPWRHDAATTALAMTLGLGAWAVMFARMAKGGPTERRLGSFALLWSLGSLAPVVLLRDHLYPYYVLLAATGWGWALGSWAGPPITRWVEAPGRRTWAPGLALTAAAVVVTAGGWAASQALMSARLPDGRLADPILRRGSIAAHLAAQLRSIPALDRRPAVAILQATRVQRPSDGSLPENAEIVLTSPVFAAVDGHLGLRLLLPPDVAGGWVTHLDDLPTDTFVFLDSGDEVLHPLGETRNARLYSALIAISAGQYDRGRHDLWTVLNEQPEQVRFAFDPESLPIEPAHLDAEATAFARFLEEHDETSSRAILRLFAKIYEAVRGRELLREPWGETERAPLRP